ncbi:MAG: AbrB/MazE/SpoVT family DNA-binding domain-containing protein [Candidatus Bathyarchaeia archaeon]
MGKKQKWDEMEEAIAKVDDKGRIIIPKNIRRKAKLKPGAYVNIKSKDHIIIIEPSESIAEKYFGIFTISKWPEDLDEFVTEATRKWWNQHAT